MERRISNYILPSGSRADKRFSLITHFMQEEPGHGNGDAASRYWYNVESYGNYSIYLLRPTQLNKGFDFTVNISGLAFKKQRIYHSPSHNDIITALESCKICYPESYPLVASAIRDIYACNDTALSEIHAGFLDYASAEHPIQIILLAIKWLFMEQDCAYWNYSGRQMLFNALCEAGLA